MSYSPESRPTNESPERQLSSLLTAIRTHNDEYGYGARIGKAMGGVLRAALENENRDSKEVVTTTVEDATGDAHSNLTALNATHQKTLETLGLALMPAPSRGENVAPTGEVLLLVVEPEKLIHAVQHFGVGQDAVAASLAKEIERTIRSIDFDEKSDDDVALIEHLPELVTAMRAAGPTAKLGSLERYAEFGPKEKLDNYLRVELGGLWTKVGEGWGPSTWVADATPETLERNWKSALQTLADQDSRGGIGVGPELREHLLQSISYSAELLSTLSWPEDYEKSLRDVLLKYTKELIAGPVN